MTKNELVSVNPVTRIARRLLEHADRPINAHAEGEYLASGRDTVNGWALTFEVLVLKPESPIEPEHTLIGAEVCIMDRLPENLCGCGGRGRGCPDAEAVEAFVDASAARGVVLATTSLAIDFPKETTVKDLLCHLDEWLAQVPVPLAQAIAEATLCYGAVPKLGGKPSVN